MITFCAYLEPEIYYIKRHRLFDLRAFYLSF